MPSAARNVRAALPPLLRFRRLILMLTTDSDPIVAIATAPGRGGIGVVRISFGRAGEAAAQPLMQALTGQALAPRHASYVPFLDDDGNPLDRGIAPLLSRAAFVHRRARARSCRATAALLCCNWYCSVASTPGRAI